MFSKGQLFFALFFVVAFTSAIILSYRKDRADHKQYFKGSYKILIGFFLALTALFLIKFFTQNN